MEKGREQANATTAWAQPHTELRWQGDHQSWQQEEDLRDGVSAALEQRFQPGDMVGGL